MELQLYLDIFKRHALAIVIVVAVAMSVVAAAGLFIPPTYTARTTVRILLDVGVTDYILREDYNKRLLNTYAEVLTSGPILEQAISRLSPRAASLSVSELRENIEVEVIANTELISISVQDGDPVLARDLANALSVLLMQYARDLYVGSSKSAHQIVDEQLAGLEDDLAHDRQQLAILLAEGGSSAEVEALTRQIEFKEDAYDRLLDRYEMARLNESLRANSVTVTAPATLPGEPSNQLGLMQVGLGLVIGLFGGVGLALTLENLDTRIHSPRQLEHVTGAFLLGTVPRGSLHLADSEYHTNGASRSLAEAYRLLGVNLQTLREDTPLKTILVTSAAPKEGKSTVSLNLAQMLAEGGQTVFLIDGDLRRPTMEEIFGIDNDLGLSSFLAKPAKQNGRGHQNELFPSNLSGSPVRAEELRSSFLSHAIHPTEQSSLFVVTGGPRVTNPTPLLRSPAMSALLDFLGDQGQTTIVDAPPVLGMADVSVLAPRVDGIILVVRQGFSSREHVREALKQLHATRARVLGLVFLQKSDKEWSY
jgi:Mrp family chromosome partitioning ATPase/capsular polysaccharide biosynthesis protein